MHSRNQTRFPVNWLRTPTVRLNLDLALPHRRNASARITVTKGAAYCSIPRRMRAQHQTQMTVHVRKLNRGMKQQSSKTTKAGPGGRNFKRIQEIQFN